MNACTIGILVVLAAYLGVGTWTSRWPLVLVGCGFLARWAVLRRQ